MNFHSPSDGNERLSAIFVDKENEDLRHIKSLLSAQFPILDLKATTPYVNVCVELVMQHHPDIVFFDEKLWHDFSLGQHVLMGDFDFETIVLTRSDMRFPEMNHSAVTGYLFKPVASEHLYHTVSYAIRRSCVKKEMGRYQQHIEHFYREWRQEKPIGIPTMEGFDFLPVREIIRCEALQRCTRVVTNAQTNLISSYNLGEFVKLLTPFDFFSPHRSHLINLRYIKKYRKEGSIYMKDGTTVPVSKGMKKTFLERVTHL